MTHRIDPPARGPVDHVRELTRLSTVARAVISEADHSRLLKDVMAPDLSV